jgi:putative lipoprotein
MPSRVTTLHGVIFRGHLRFGHEVRSFQPCGKDVEYWVVDRIGGELWDIYSALIPNPYEPLYVEVRGVLGPPPDTGFGVDYDRLLTVTSLRRAAVETRACAEDLRRFEFRAYGDEPFWNTDISEEGIIFSVLGEPQRAFPYTAAKVSGAHRLYSSKTQGPNQHWIQIFIDEKRCIDSMSGEHSGFTAKVSLGGRTYVGCAREGWANLPGVKDRDLKIMTMSMLENTVYRSEFSPDGVIRLVDGIHKEKIVSGAAAELIVSLGKVAIGDLNGDGFEDGAVVLVTSAGGSGTFRHLAAVLNRNGTPEHIAVFFLGDRIRVESLSIRSGKIEAAMLIHDTDDPMPRPTLKVVQKYELRNDALVPLTSGFCELSDFAQLEYNAFAGPPL